MKSKLFAVVGLLCSAVGVWAQSSTFTYQGQLSSNGIAATGLFDVRFALYDAATAGNPVGTVLTNSPTGVTNGLFQVSLSFGSSVFDGSSRWLELGVHTNGSAGAFTILAPRQLITATPYAVRAANFSGTLASTNLTGKISDTNLSANVVLLTNNANFTQSVSASNFIGNGLGLTNLSATNLTGILPDARLSANVPLKNAATNAFLGSISATNYYGEGRGLTNVPGRIFEVVTTATSIQAYANYGYLATNDTTAVVVTLPQTADIRTGETIRVSGSGAAGWIVAQNTNQTILAGNLLNNVGVSWRTNTGGINFKALAVSTDGQKIVTVINGGGIWTSTNYGVAWVQSPSAPSSASWTAVASSADGTKLAATVSGSYVYTSTDTGTNWTARTGSGTRTWTGIASSLDGNKLFGCVSGTGVFYSTNAGVNWYQGLSLAVSFTGIAASSDGNNLVAVAQGGQVYTSATNGVSGSWIARESNRSWTCVASSIDGSVLVAGVNSVNNYLYVSGDFGTSWVPGTTAANWAGVACSADGSRMIAVANGSGVYISQDSGLTWQLRGNLPTGIAYTSAACSSDASTMAAAATANGIYISSKSTTTLGTSGGLIGTRLAAVELEHVGNGVFIPISSVGVIRLK
ncbi:MAG: hypothetical protein QM813_23370 [Verrucomicrobiota bacterium]